MDQKFKDLKLKQEEIFLQTSQILNIISSPVRLKLIHLLSQGPQSVETLAAKTDQSIANTSMHLRKMWHEKILKVESQGQKRIYSLAHPSLHHFWEEIQNFIESLNESLNFKHSVEDIYGDIHWPLSLAETVTKIIEGELKVHFIDVRPDEEIEPLEFLQDLSTIQAASPSFSYKNIPSSELSSQFSSLPFNKKGEPILILCRGRFCAVSARAVDELNQQIKRKKKDLTKVYRLNHSWFALKKEFFRQQTIHKKMRTN